MIPAAGIAGTANPFALCHLDIDDGRSDSLHDTRKPFDELGGHAGSIRQHRRRGGKSTSRRQERSKQTTTTHDAKLCLHG